MGLRGYLILLELPTFALHCVVTQNHYLIFSFCDVDKDREKQEEEEEEEKKNQEVIWYHKGYSLAKRFRLW